MTAPMGLAVVGCGVVSRQYFAALTSYRDVRVVACADLDLNRARAAAAEWGVPHALTVDEALAHPDVELIVNLTIPAAHDTVAAAAIAAGRHVYNEKPLSMSRKSGQALLDTADQMGVRVGGAPDTFLSAGMQAGLRAIAKGGIGTPQTALVLLHGPGPESWHQAPEFLYQPGGGPLLDLGPYYLTALVAAFGPAARVAAVGRKAFTHRTIGAGPRAGTRFEVEVFTHVSALVEFAGGQAATLVFSFDSPLDRWGFLEVTGTEAVLALPDPNRFDGVPRRHAAGQWQPLPVPADAPVTARGSGVVEMARAIRAGAPHRASGAQALHVLDLMLSIEDAAATGRHVELTTGFTPPEPLPPGWDPAR